MITNIKHALHSLSLSWIKELFYNVNVLLLKITVKFKLLSYTEEISMCLVLTISPLHLQYNLQCFFFYISFHGLI